MDSELIAIQAADGVRLAAELYTTKVARPLGTIIMVHGFGGNRHENGFFDYLAEYLVARDYHVVQYDWRGLGDSEGDFASSTIEQHVEDLLAVQQWTTERFGKDAERLHAVGFSLGAAVVSLAMQEAKTHHQQLFDRVAFLAPALQPNLSMAHRYNTKQIREAIERDGYYIKPDTNIRLGLPIIESLGKTDLGVQAFDIDRPLLVCHGDADERIDISFSRRLHKQRKGTNQYRFQEIKRGSHSFKDVRRKPIHFWGLVAIELANWFDAPDDET